MDFDEIKCTIIIIAVLGGYRLWEWKKEDIPEIIKKIVYWVCYLAAVYIFVFVYEDWVIRFLALLLLPCMSCMAIFGRWKKWATFKDFLKEYYESDGLWMLSLLVIALYFLVGYK